MDYEERVLLIRKARKIYDLLGKVACPALGAQIVKFDERGFRHLIRRTNIEDLRRRIDLLPFCTIVIGSSDSNVGFREKVMRAHMFKHWALEKRIGHKSITVIVGQVDSGPIHFVSVMDR